MVKKFLFSILFFLTISHAGIDQLTVSPGTWIVQSEGDRETPLFFNKAAIDGYFTMQRVKLFASLPLALSLDPENEKVQFGLGDVTLYGGLSIGKWEPRVGLIAPGIYSTDADKAWIGSQDLKIGAGFAFKPQRGQTYGFLFSLESMVYFYISQEFGFGAPGSIEIPSIIKASYYFSSGMKLHLETLVNASSIEWEWNPADTRSVTLSVVPVVSLSKNLSSFLDLGIKVGAGPGWEKLGDATLEKKATNISLGMYFDFMF